MPTKPGQSSEAESVRIRLFFIALGVVVPLLVGVALLPTGLPRTVGVVITGIVMWRYGYRGKGR